MELRPSDIRFSQDSINNVFDKRSLHSYKPIGQTLDELCENRCSVYNIPRITVVREGGKWITADNRRLWVFREMERLGKCETIPVTYGSYIPLQKRTSHNGGTSVVVRGNPGGIWHSKPTVSRQPSSIRLPPQDRSMGTTISRNYIKPIQPALSHLNPGLDSRPGSYQSNSLFHRYENGGRRRSAFFRDSQGPPFESTKNQSSNRGNTSNLQDQRDDIRSEILSGALLSLRATIRSSSMAVRAPRSCVARHTYGFGVSRKFIPGVDPEERKVVIDGEIMCQGRFDEFIPKDMYISVGETFDQKVYSSSFNKVWLKIYRSELENPRFVDEAGCSFVDKLEINFTDTPGPRNKLVLVEIMYDGMKLNIKAKILATDQVYEKDIELH